MATLIEHGAVASSLSLVSAHRAAGPTVSPDKSVPSILPFKSNVQFPDPAFYVDKGTYLQENGHGHTRQSEGDLVQIKNDITLSEETRAEMEGFILDDNGTHVIEGPQASKQCEPQANLPQGLESRGDLCRGNILVASLHQDHNLAFDLCQQPEQVRLSQANLPQEPVLEGDSCRVNILVPNLHQEHDPEFNWCQQPGQVQVPEDIASQDGAVEMNAGFYPEGKKVQWNDKHGKELAHVLEFEVSDDDFDEEASSHVCTCSIQ